MRIVSIYGWWVQVSRSAHVLMKARAGVGVFLQTLHTPIAINSPKNCHFEHFQTRMFSRVLYMQGIYSLTSRQSIGKGV